MSTGTPTSVRRRQFLTPSMRMMLLIWGIVIVGAWFLYSWNEANNEALRDDVANAKNSIVDLKSDIEAGSPQLKSELGRLREDSQSLVKRLVDLESALGTYDGQFQILKQQASEVESQRAVQRARVAVLAAQARSARSRLNELKKLQANWTAQDISLLTGDPGRHIAGSPNHLELTMEILDRDRPTPEQIVQWELKLDALAAPITEASSDKDSLITITDEHARMLTDLGQQLAKSAADFGQQQRLLVAIRNETSSLPLNPTTLDVVIRERRATAEKEEASRIAAIRQAARAEAETQQAETLATLERELVEAKTKREEGRLRAETAREEQLAKIEQEQIAEEGRVKIAEREATIAGLKEEAARVGEAVRLAQLEREFEQALPAIRGYLSAFTEPGFKHRADGSKGPVSLALLKSNGALQPTRPGMERLMVLASVGNDRPLGAIPRYIGSDNGWRMTNKTPIEKAQELLKKYGDLMVKKEMLAP